MNFPYPAIIKSQIAIGSRKKAGLIKLAKNQEEATSLCKEFFTRVVAGFNVEAILIEALVTIQQEYYCSIALDASGRRFFLIASREGGIDIEEVSKSNPDAIIKEEFSYRTGLTANLAEKIANNLEFSIENLISAKDIFLKLWKIVVDLEAQLVEINPLVITPSGLIAVDGKMILDEDSAFRQPIVEELLIKKLSEFEKFAKEAGFSFIKLKGDIGILANGAGLTMALLDVLSSLELKPANFLDVGGGASKERIYKALELLFKMNPKAVFVNIYGGITRCDAVAEAIIEALHNFKSTPPMVIRLTGTNEIEGIKILKKNNITVFKDVMEAVKKLKEVMKK
ncbi:MAG: succinate--CoA ligase subunit beta [Candidatus Lokiarchaeota archaeon]|nr:succinate--CoA ligase subunit beta [Candidatus Lokiarchaeota archaeon]